MRVKDIPGIDQMSAPEKILLVEDLWNNIAEDETNVPVPDSHVQELNKRIKGLDAHPDKLLLLEELQHRV